MEQALAMPAHLFCPVMVICNDLRISITSFCFSPNIRMNKVTIAGKNSRTGFATETGILWLEPLRIVGIFVRFPFTRSERSDRSNCSNGKQNAQR